MARLTKTISLMLLIVSFQFLLVFSEGKWKPVSNFISLLALKNITRLLIQFYINTNVVVTHIFCLGREVHAVKRDNECIQLPCPGGLCWCCKETHNCPDRNGGTKEQCEQICPAQFYTIRHCYVLCMKRRNKMNFGFFSLFLVKFTWQLQYNIISFLPCMFRS